MDALKDYPKEYAKCFWPSFSLLNKANIRYFTDHESFLKKNWKFIYIVPLIILFLMASTTHLSLLVLNKQMAELSYFLPAFLVTVHASLKCVIMIPKSSELTAIIEDLGKIWRTSFTETQNAEKDAVLKKLNFCNSVTYWVSLLGTTQYLLTPVFETLVRRYILKQDFELHLPIAASYPFDPTENWFIYFAVHALQLYTMFTLVFVYTGSELMMITLCALLGTEFTLLGEDLTHGDEEANINNFVKRHQTLIRLTHQLDLVFNRLIFVDLLFVGVTTCAFSLACEFARGLTYTFSNYVALAVCQATVLYLCYYGELLTGASARIGNVAYESLWYKYSKQYKMTIFLIIMMSQKPCRLTSLKYATVSLNMFSKVVSTTWSYFSLLNSVDFKAETDTPAT